MADSVLERAAKAHYEKTIKIVAITRPGAPFIAWENLPEEQRRLSLAGTRAAIEALREPTEAMLFEGAMGPRMGDNFDMKAAKEDANNTWRPMIDAILNEQEGSG